jgi:hypothetical protein
MPCRPAALSPRSLVGLAMMFGLALLLMPVAATAQQYTPEQRAACEPDAMRLCQEFVPDIQRITACMYQKRRYVSARCRAVMFGARKRR